MKILIKIIKGVLTIAVLIILPIVIFTFITSKTSIFGIQSFVVLSGSMTPTLPVGSMIYTQKQNSYHEGEIVAFKSADVNVTHRVSKINNDGSFQTKGDANDAVDSKAVQPNDVIGKEFAFLPYLGRVAGFLKEPIGFFSIIVFPLITFIVLELWNLKKEIEKEVEKKLQKKMGLAP